MPKPTGLLALSAMPDFISEITNCLSRVEGHLHELKGMETGEGPILDNHRLAVILREHYGIEQNIPNYTIQLNFWKSLDLSVVQLSEIKVLLGQVNRLAVANANVVQQVKMLLQFFDQSSTATQQMLAKIMGLQK